MTATAVVCAVLFPMPDVIAIPIILWITVALPAVLTTIIIYGGGYQRTFCVGTLFPSAIILLMMPFGGRGLFMFGLPGGEDFLFRLAVGIFWVSSLLIGLVCVGVRRLVEKRPASPPD